MSYVSTENYNEVKQTEEKTLNISKKSSNSNDVSFEIRTVTQEIQGSYKLTANTSNIIIMKRLVDVRLCEV